MATVLLFGVDSKLYVDTSGTAWAGTFSEVKNVNDGLSADLAWDTANSQRRGYGAVVTEEPTSLKTKLKWKMLEDSGDTIFLNFRTAFFLRTLVALLAVGGGAYTTNGLPYLRGDFKVTSFNKGEMLNGINTYDVEATPCASSNLFTTGVTPIGSAGLG